MPPGWITQWDQNSQRWYYVDQSTGRSQWDPPVHSPAPQGPYAPPPGTPTHDERGLFGSTPNGGHDSFGEHKEKKEKNKGHSTAAMAAAGIGGVAAGAWIGHELSMPLLRPDFGSTLML